MTLQELVARFLAQERSIGQLLHETDVQAQARAAADFYAGWGALAPGQSDTRLAGLTGAQAAEPKPRAAEPFTDMDTDISPSAWAVIRPLFLLYVEREEARLGDLTANMGLTSQPVRALSEIESDIKELCSPETPGGIPSKAFSQPIITV